MAWSSLATLISSDFDRIHDFVKTPSRKAKATFTHTDRDSASARVPKRPHPEMAAVNSEAHTDRADERGRRLQQKLFRAIQKTGCTANTQSTVTVLQGIFYQPHLHSSVYFLLTGYKTPTSSLLFVSLNVKSGSFFKKKRTSSLWTILEV